ncbi:SURF1 family protein [Marinobacter halophilus]|uniref:SURF1-like protein n=1 Tax=Marinobacter halophilus TaxID=1323740 RepID=A0A2T1KIT2_9GAMM|nr:SURF1 family protein [Marinobacter halophilus]PSF10029.1 SURF1 family protein [Marinobacter halophilus]GGC67114.1 SURF1-like protein [Marinobacter halophilus]
MNRRWHFDWRLLVFSGLLLPVLISLGVWQLDRADEKQVLLASWQQHAVDASWPEMVATGLRVGQPVTLTGWYTDYSWLLDNRTRDGFPGYEVLTLFMPIEGPPVVVNRGWVRAPRTRDQLPAIETPEVLVTLEGRLDNYPVPPVLADDSGAESSSWPQRVQTLPRARVQEQVDNPVVMVLKLADRQQPGAYRADHTPDMMGPQTHYGYAAQWFALAVALTILTVVASTKKTASNRKTGADNDNDNG